MWLSSCFLDPDAFERAKQRFEAWNTHLNTLPSDIWMSIFKACITHAKTDISTLAQVCKRWNELVRKHAKHLIHVYLQQTYKQACLMTLINMHASRLKEYKTLWGFRAGNPDLNESEDMFTNIYDHENGTMVPYCNIYALNRITRGTVCFLNDHYELLCDNVENLELDGGEFYSGPVDEFIVPTDTDEFEYEVTITKKRKIK